MNKSIVLKWSLLTAFIFTVLLLFIGIAQNYFFAEFYTNKKSESLEKYMDEYTDMELKIGAEAASDEFYKNNHTWIVKLDEFGRISDVENYYIEVTLDSESGDIMKIPMYPFEGEYSSDALTSLRVGNEVIIDTVNRKGESIPYQIQTGSTGIINLNLANKLNGPNADKAFCNLETGLYRGTITKTQFPDKMVDIPFPYNDSFFLGLVKEFQTDLLKNNTNSHWKTSKLSTTENFTEYKIIIKPIDINGETGYIFAMTSLQPVDEAIAVMTQFYPYLFGVAILCIIVLAFIFSKWLAKPLISLSRITGKIADMDFTEKMPVHSTDEIGQLSQNINNMSVQMETYIRQLKQDLDKEKKLEDTRKEFIAGVSHELKTPLAVMRSCLSILKDGIAVEKRDHYFQAMEDEIQRTDLLVVNMLDLAKFESGTYKPELVPFEIDIVIEEIYKSQTEQIQMKNLNVALDIYPQMVVGHKGLISRVITNFLTNAIQHTENEHTITITIKSKEQMEEISVENQGKGISNEDIEKIWNHFYRAKTRSSQLGTGLGLAISKEILELHSSSYGVENTIDGVRFFFTLPIHL
jgi:two-component system, OmpR family, sensor histidine kinase VanS